jgi:hypothetical protein
MAQNVDELLAERPDAVTELAPNTYAVLAEPDVRCDRFVIVNGTVMSRHLRAHVLSSDAELLESGRMCCASAHGLLALRRHRHAAAEKGARPDKRGRQQQWERRR